jgi:hypothetical protein
MVRKLNACLNFVNAEFLKEELISENALKNPA